jgi:hypothetical protein
MAAAARLKTSDFPDEPVLRFLLPLLTNPKPQPATWFPGFPNSVSSVFPEGTPKKLVLSKMKSMIRRGLVIGCACGCRGDFWLSDKGEARCFWLKN